jgi:dephospho-CoA kinase
MPGVTRIALTGNIASGKSAVAAVWRGNGAVIIDADELARRAVAPGTRGLRRVVRTFGRSVLGPDGTLDRAALRRVVFTDERKRRQLEDIIHPEVDRLRRAAEREAVAAGARYVVHVIPLLFEKGLAEGFPVVVLVDAPEQLRLDRIVQTRGVAPDEARRMIAAQQPAAANRARATHVIDNAGTLEELERRAEDVWAQIEAAAP